MAVIPLLSFIGALIFSAGLTWIVRNLALRRGWARGPVSARHIHSVGMPRVGGIAISAVVVVISCTAMFAMVAFHGFSKKSVVQVLLVLFAALINFGIGLADDFLDLPARVKLTAEIFAGVLLWSTGIRILHLSSLFHSHEFGATFSFILTVSWVVLISNAFNLIDGLDGLAAGSALFSVLTVFVVSLITHNAVQGLLSAVLAGAILGFLRYNFNPATVYLGDCGSLFIGTLLAGLTLTGNTQQKSSTLVAVAIPLVAFGLPVVETSVSVVRRFLRGQSLFSADREHIHHKLLDHGWSHRQVVITLYAVSALFGLLSLALLVPGQTPLAIVLLVLGIGIVLAVQKLGYHEFFEVGRMVRRTLEQRQVICNNLTVRRGAEKLARCVKWPEIASILEETFENNDFDSLVLTVKATASDEVIWKHQWQRPVPRMDSGLETTHQWSLNLPLQGVKGGWNGSWELSRLDNSILFLDINLLVREFKAELERACNRAVIEDEKIRRQADLREGHPKMLPATLEVSRAAGV